MKYLKSKPAIALIAWVVGVLCGAYITHKAIRDITEECYIQNEPWVPRSKVG